MRLIAQYAMRGRFQSVTVIAVFTVLSLLVAPLAYLGAAGLVLVTLRHGGREALVVGAAAMLGTGLLATLALGSFVPALAVALSLWLPVTLLALVLRATGSQALVMLLAGALSALVVVLLHLFLESPAEWWRQALEEVLAPALDRQGVSMDPQALENIAALMTGLVAVASMTGQLLSLWLGRWWQSVLYKPGGFGEEFRALRLPRALAVATLVLVGIAMAAPGEFGRFAGELAIIGMALFVFQGLAVVHALVKQRGASVGWLFGTYVLLLVMGAPATIALGAAGMADTWIDFRRKGLQD